MTPVDTPAESTGPQRVRPRSGPSISDVAAVAGVSAQTVSRVSTGSEPVRPETRERVLAAMAQLGYSPNNAARALRNAHFETLGVIAHRLARTGEARTFEAVVEAARDHGYTVTLVDLQSPSSAAMSDAVARLTHQSIDGLVIIRAEEEIPATLALPNQLPVVVSDSRFVGHHPAVATDQADGTRQVVQHLLGLGHLTVHHLAGPAESSPAQLRVDSWRAALSAEGRAIPELFRGDWSADSGYAVGRRIANDPSITAVFCANDEMAAGFCRALHEAGIRVPQDVSVVGFDDIPLAGYLWPPLTTVAQDFQRVGNRLVELLLEQIRTSTKLVDTRVLVPVELVVRSSTAAPGVRR